MINGNVCQPRKVKWIFIINVEMNLWERYVSHVPMSLRLQGLIKLPRDGLITFEYEEWNCLLKNLINGYNIKIEL